MADWSVCGEFQTTHERDAPETRSSKTEPCLFRNVADSCHRRSHADTDPVRPHLIEFQTSILDRQLCCSDPKL
jgi:hypothetical protein